jgi:hypothetical protein
MVVIVVGENKSITLAGSGMVNGKKTETYKIITIEKRGDWDE